MTAEVADAGKLGAARTLVHQHGGSTGASSGDLIGTEALSMGCLILVAAVALVAQQHAETSAVAQGSMKTALRPRRAGVLPKSLLLVWQAFWQVVGHVISFPKSCSWRGERPLPPSRDYLSLATIYRWERS